MADLEILGLELDQALKVIFIIILAVFVGKILSIYTTKILRKKMTMDHVKIITKGIYSVIFFIALIAILPLIGIDMSGLVVAGGIFAIVIGFAAQGIVGNLISGIFLIFERPVKIGDVVNIDNTIGQVEDIRIISTTIRTFDGNFVRIPNMTVFNSKIINHFVNKARRFEYVVGIRYRDDADRAVNIIKEIIDAHPFALKYPEPMVFVNELGNSSVDILVKVWAPFTEWYSVKMTLLWKIKTGLEENDIVIPFPQREVWFNNKLPITERIPERDHIADGNPKEFP